ncbi:MAG: hypothetical protein RDV41_04845 [Planctomycetota bacterium]|nr:hypothetical protein [Planctomycetota bacterium]
MEEASNSPKKGDTAIRDRRRVYLIDREFQFKFLSTWLLMTLGFIVVIIAVMFVGARLVRELSSEAAMLERLSEMLRYNAGAIVLITILLALYTVFLSHRIAGPAYRIEKCLERMAAGDYYFTVTLRKNDYLTGVAEAVNTTVRKLAERHKTLMEVRANMEKLSAKLVEPGGIDEAKQLAATVLGQLAKAAPSNMKLGPDAK